MGSEADPHLLIYEAIDEGDIDQLRSLFVHFPDFVNWEVPGFGTWLIYASRFASVDVLNFLINAGFDVNALNNRGDAGTLEGAAQEASVENTAFLLNRGATIRTESSTLNPLFGAIIGQSLEVAELLLDSGIDTSKRYVLGAPDNPSIDAVAFAMLRGEQEIAHQIALRNSKCNEVEAQEALAESLRLAEQITE